MLSNLLLTKIFARNWDLDQKTRKKKPDVQQSLLKYLIQVDVVYNPEIIEYTAVLGYSLSWIIFCIIKVPFKLKYNEKNIQLKKWTMKIIYLNNFETAIFDHTDFTLYYKLYSRHSYGLYRGEITLELYKPIQFKRERPMQYKIMLSGHVHIHVV